VHQIEFSLFVVSHLSKLHCSLYSACLHYSFWWQNFRPDRLLKWGFVPHSKSGIQTPKITSMDIYAGALKMRDWKMRDWNNRHQTAPVENGGLELSAPYDRGGTCGTGKFRNRKRMERHVWHNLVFVLVCTAISINRHHKEWQWTQESVVDPEGWQGYIPTGIQQFCRWKIPPVTSLLNLLTGYMGVSMIIITSAEEGGYVFGSVSLSVCLFVCLSTVCLSVCRITRKLVNGFWRNFLEG